MEQGSITHKQFSQLEFPNLPYCAFELINRKSDNYTCAFRYFNADTGFQLNVFWYEDKRVAIYGYNRLTNGVAKNIIGRFEEFNQQILNEICKKYLG